jgi:hypothetical protein
VRESRAHRCAVRACAAVSNPLEEPAMAKKKAKKKGKKKK